MMAGMAEVKFPHPEEDFYAILGCDASSSHEQLSAEYKAKALQLHPDKRPDEPVAKEDFERLQRAKEILCCEETRQLYDRWLACGGMAMRFKDWEARKELVAMTMHWAGPEKPQPSLEAAESSRGAENASKEGQPTGVLKWSSSRDTAGILDKFRNYDI